MVTKMKKAAFRYFMIAAVMFSAAACQEPVDPVDPVDPTTNPVTQVPDVLAGQDDVADTTNALIALGYYKDIFMNSGISLTNRNTLYAAGGLGLQLETFRIPADKDNDSDPVGLEKQTEIFVGCDEDKNGRLLYPDGAPRYRMVYFNGGSSNEHGKSLGEAGLQRVRDYFAGGGCYVGSCAGSAIVSQYRVTPTSTTDRKDYLRIWPGAIRLTSVSQSYSTFDIEPGSPLLNYGYTFGGDMVVEDVWHNGGNYAYEEQTNGLPAGTEVLARYRFLDSYDESSRHLDKRPGIWAYKPQKSSGRMVVIGSHPEKESQTSNLEAYELFCAMIKYALDGAPGPTLKAELKDGVQREVSLSSDASDKSRVMIGDLQYHHYTTKVPAKCKKMTVELEGFSGKDFWNLSLYAKKADYAFKENALFKNTSQGATKKLVIDYPVSGTWHLSVRCEDTVGTSPATSENYGTEYISRTAVLNGVPYKIKVSFETY